jgi:hypothetical protein
MKRSITFFLILLISGIIASGCGKDNNNGGKPSAKSQLENLQPANVSDPAVLSDAVGSAIMYSQMGTDMSGGFSMGMMSSLKIPILKGSRLKVLQNGKGGNCTGTQDHFTCTEQCAYGGSSTLDCSGNNTSATCKMTFDNCKDNTDEAPLNGDIQIDAKSSSGSNVTITMSVDLTSGKGYIYGSYNLSMTQTANGGTIKATLDMTGADDVDPTNVAFVYFDETITMQDIGNYEFTATVNGNGEFGTTKDGKVSVAINNVVIDPSTCWMEPTSGTTTVSAGSASVTVTFDGGSGSGTPPQGCDGKVMCSGSYNGEIDISGSSEPIINF